MSKEIKSKKEGKEKQQKREHEGWGKIQTIKLEEIAIQIKIPRLPPIPPPPPPPGGGWGLGVRAGWCIYNKKKKIRKKN